MKLMIRIIIMRRIIPKDNEKDNEKDNTQGYQG